MFEKILYPTDFSDVSKKALDYIKRLKEAGTKKVTATASLGRPGLIEVMKRLGFKKHLEMIGMVLEPL